jgi:hypothetical protein
MVTIPAEVVDRSVPAVSAASSARTSFPVNSGPTTFWRLGSGGEAEGLQKRQCQHALTPILDNSPGQQLHTWGFDYMRTPFAHYPTTPRDNWQSFGQLHGWSEGVVPFCLPFGFPFRQGALALGRFVTWLSFGCLTLFCFCRGARKKVVWLGDVGLWWVAPVQLCVSLQRIFSQRLERKRIYSETSRTLTGFGGFCAKNNSGT